MIAHALIMGMCMLRPLAALPPAGVAAGVRVLRRGNVANKESEVG